MPHCWFVRVIVPLMWKPEDELDGIFKKAKDP